MSKLIKETTLAALDYFKELDKERIRTQLSDAARDASVVQEIVDQSQQVELQVQPEPQEEIVRLGPGKAKQKDDTIQKDDAIVEKIGEAAKNAIIIKQIIDDSIQQALNKQTTDQEISEEQDKEANFDHNIAERGKEWYKIKRQDKDEWENNAEYDAITAAVKSRKAQPTYPSFTDAKIPSAQKDTSTVTSKVIRNFVADILEDYAKANVIEYKEYSSIKSAGMQTAVDISKERVMVSAPVAKVFKNADGKAANFSDEAQEINELFVKPIAKAVNEFDKEQKAITSGVVAIFNEDEQEPEETKDSASKKWRTYLTSFGEQIIEGKIKAAGVEITAEATPMEKIKAGAAYLKQVVSERLYKYLDNKAQDNYEQSRQTPVEEIDYATEERDAREKGESKIDSISADAADDYASGSQATLDRYFN